MLKRRKKIYLNSQDRSVLLQCLIEMKNRLLQEGRYTDCIDDVIIKLINTSAEG